MMILKLKEAKKSSTCNMNSENMKLRQRNVNLEDLWTGKSRILKCLSKQVVMMPRFMKDPVMDFYYWSYCGTSVGSIKSQALLSIELCDSTQAAILKTGWYVYLCLHRPKCIHIYKWLDMYYDNMCTDKCITKLGCFACK
jgi:hypothetical protein